MVDSLSPLERPSDEDFQLFIRTVWSLHRCNFLSPVSEQFCCSICFLSDVSVWSLSSRVAELGDPSSPLPLPTLILLSQTFSWPLLFSIFFLSLLPSFHKLPPSPSAFLLFLFSIHFLLFLFYSSILQFTLKALGLCLYSALQFTKASHGPYSI